MEHCLLIARSVTQAQRMEKALARAGIRAGVFRTPMELTDSHGCTYAVQIPQAALTESLTSIRGAGLNPVQIFLSGPDGYREVPS